MPIDLPIPELAPDAAPAKSQKELFDFQITTTLTASKELFAVPRVVKDRKARKIK